MVVGVLRPCNIYGYIRTGFISENIRNTKLLDHAILNSNQMFMVLPLRAYVMLVLNAMQLLGQRFKYVVQTKQY